MTFESPNIPPHEKVNQPEMEKKIEELEKNEAMLKKQYGGDKKTEPAFPIIAMSTEAIIRNREMFE